MASVDRCWLLEETSPEKTQHCHPNHIISCYSALYYQGMPTKRNYLPCHPWFSFVGNSNRIRMCAKIKIERDTNAQNVIVSPTSEAGQIHLNPGAILFTSTLHFDRQSAFFLLKRTFALSSSTCPFHLLFSLHFCLWPSTSKSNTLLKTWPSMTWQTLLAIANWSMVHSNPTSTFSIFQLYSTDCSDHGSLCPLQNSLLSFFQAQCFTFIQNNLANCNPLLKYPFHSSVINVFHQCLILLCLFSSQFVLETNSTDWLIEELLALYNSCNQPLTPRHANSPTVFTSSHYFFSCFTASTISPSHFTPAEFLENTGVTVFPLAHLPLIHLPHHTHKTKLAFTVTLKTPHGPTLLLDNKPSFVMLQLTITLSITFLDKPSFVMLPLTITLTITFLDKPSFVMLPLTITLVLPKSTFKPMVSKVSFHSMNLFLNPLIVSLIRTQSSAYINSLITSLANSMTTSTTAAKIKGE